MQGLNSANIYQTCVEVDQVLNTNKAYQDGRNLILSPGGKAQMLLCDKFVKALERGDGGETMATAQIGTVLNLNTYMCQNVNDVELGADTDTSKTLDATAYAAEYAGALAATANGCAAGEFVTVVGNDQPTYCTAVATNSITLNEPLKYAILASAPYIRYKGCGVASGTPGTTYPTGWSEAINLTGMTSGLPPQIGQLIAFTDSDGVSNRQTYTVVEVLAAATTTATVLLERPLDHAITTSSLAFPGPYGSFNVCLHKNAIALVTRPLATVTGAGMLCAVQSADGIGVRVAMQDMINVGRVVSIDMLAGVALLDWRLGCAMLG